MASRPMAVSLPYIATSQMIEDCHRRFRDDALVEELITLLEKHVRERLLVTLHDWLVKSNHHGKRPSDGLFPSPCKSNR